MSVGIHARADRFEGAIDNFHRAIEPDPNIGLAYHHVGTVYGRMGKLEKAYEERDHLMVFLDIYLEDEHLRSDPRFKAMMKKMCPG